MDRDDREQVLDRAEKLLPKYGGMVEGAVNQALLLLGIWADADTYKSLVAALDAREHAAKLAEVDTSDVPPFVHGKNEGWDDNDRPAASLPLDDVFANAPDRDGDYFRTPPA